MEILRRNLTHALSNLTSAGLAEIPFPDISLLEDLDSSAKVKKKKETICSTMSAAELDLQD